MLIRLPYLTSRDHIFKFNRRGYTTTIIWISIYLFGIAFICFLPPWEGYDEVAHYSYLQQMADTGQPPSVEQGKLSAEVEAYTRVAPTPYSTTAPFDKNGGVTYREWFANDDLAKNLPHSKPSHPRQYSPGETSNWQGQHPEFYYRLLAPITWLTSDLSWSSQLFLLRWVSWTLAFLGLMISISATARMVKLKFPEMSKDYSKLSMSWPLIFPGLIPEFARLGNDSLVVLILSLVWFLLIKRIESSQRWYWYVALGVILGLGGLTKITFLPITIAVVIWLTWLEARGNLVDRFYASARSLLVLGLFFCFSAKRYFSNLTEHGSVTGLVELSSTDVPTGLFWVGAFHYPIEIIKGVLGIGMTFIWGSTASSAYPPVIFVLPLVFLLFGILGASLHLLKHKNNESAVLALLIIGAVGSGLIYYLLIRIAVTGVGAGAPGWYFHTLIAPLSLMLAAGWNLIRTKIAFASLLWRFWLGYMALFCISVTWLQLTLFAGCSFKTSESRIYSLNDLACILDVPFLHHRLEALTFPTLGWTTIGLAVVLIYTAYSRNRGIDLQAGIR